MERYKLNILQCAEKNRIMGQNDQWRLLLISELLIASRWTSHRACRRQVCRRLLIPNVRLSLPVTFWSWSISSRLDSRAWLKSCTSLDEFQSKSRINSGEQIWFWTYTVDMNSRLLWLSTARLRLASLVFTQMFPESWKKLAWFWCML